MLLASAVTINFPDIMIHLALSSKAREGRVTVFHTRQPIVYNAIKRSSATQHNT
jgi:hypothetical protein